MKPAIPLSNSKPLALLWLATLLPFTAFATSDLSQVPLHSIKPVAPNIFFLNDDSDSMDYEVMFNDIINQGRLAKEDAGGFDYTNVISDDKIKSLSSNVIHAGSCSFTSGNAYIAILDTGRLDNSCSGGNSPSEPTEKFASEEEWRVRFYETNPLYYNPAKTYKPWPGTNPNTGAAFPNMNLEAAKIDPSDSNSPTINLKTESAVLIGPEGSRTRSYYGTNRWNSWCTTYTTLTPATGCRGWRYYYRDANKTIGMKWVRELSETDQTNFANWFSYHRSRKNVAKFAIGTAVANASGKRLGYGAINDVINNNTNDIAFIDENNQATVYRKLYNTSKNGLTPLQAGLNWVGEYFESGKSDGTNKRHPILSADDGGACQLNNTVLVTDGFYTGSAYLTETGAVAGFAKDSTIDDFDGDSYPDTLGDIAKYYSSRDLSNLPNLVPTGTRDSNGNQEVTHQHMNTHTIAFGLTGTILPPDSGDMNDLDASTITTWPDPRTQDTTIKDTDSIPARIDDLFHAAKNSGGKYYSATDPDKLVKAINSIVTAIPNATDSSNTVSATAFKIDGNDKVIVTSFDPAYWSGTIKALNVNSDGSLVEDPPAWSSDDTLTFSSAREIITYDKGVGIPFTWDGIKNTTLATKLDAESDIAKNRLNYLRGQEDKEFRSRKTVLGDIVNSSPVHVGAPALLYPDRPPFGKEGDRYSNFWQTRKSRAAMVYVGANDGMLHGFDLSNGEEKLAYAPAATFDKLQDYTSKSYAHQFSVDQTPTVADAYIKTAQDSTDQWRTVLVSGLGAGGRGLFALNITDPATFEESNANKIAMWEFTNDDDGDLGYTLAKPVIGMTEDNRWVAIAGNGYGSNEGNAALFILNLNADARDKWDSSTEYTKIVADPEDKTGGNGLFSPAAVDSDGNGKIDHVYAGDLKGNLWVFKLDSTGYTARKLFTTASGQPITVKPTVVPHPTQATTNDNKPNMMVLFGTGRYLNQDDINNSDQQSFYAVWDDGGANRNRDDDLVLQRISEEKTDTATGKEARLTSSNDVSYGVDVGRKYGWYINLTNPDDPTPSERVITSASVFQGIVFFTTYIPSNDPCEGGGDSWFMFLKLYNGAPPDEAIISINNDRVIDDKDDSIDWDGDQNTDKQAPSGLKIEGGVFGMRLTQESILLNTVDRDQGIANLAHNLGDAASLGKRISWRELRKE